MSRNKANISANAKHRANQTNPAHPAWQKVNDNKSNQGNPNNPVYGQSRNLSIPANKK